MDTFSLDEDFRRLRIEYLDKKEQLTDGKIMHLIAQLRRFILGHIDNKWGLSENEVRECCSDSEWRRIQIIKERIRTGSHAAIRTIHYGMSTMGMINVYASEYFTFSESWFKNHRQ